MGNLRRSFSLRIPDRIQQGTLLNPIFTSGGSFSVVENTTEVGNVSASPSGCTYSIVTGDDGSNFEINATSGVLSFVSAPDFENPTDVGSNISRDENGWPILDEFGDPVLDGDDIPDNIYYVRVRATKGSRYADKYIVVTVTDVADSLEPETTAYIARMTETPNETYEDAINVFIKDGLKPVWSKIPAFWISANHNIQASTLNVMQNAFNLTYVNSPNFQAGLGVNSNGSTSYAKTGYNPSIEDSINGRSSSNLGFVLVSQTDLATVGATYGDFGGMSQTSTYLYQLCTIGFNSTKAIFIALNQGTYATQNITSTAGIFMFYIESSRLKIMRNKIIIYDEPQGSTTDTPDTELGYMCRSFENTFQPEYASTKVFSMSGIMAGITTAEAEVLTDEINNYLTTLGCGLY